MVMDGRAGFKRTLLAAAALLAATVGTTLGGSLDQELEAAISGSKLGSEMKLSVTILDGASGEVLGEHAPGRSMIPASNMKLLTSGTALSVLGTDFAFETEILLDGETVIVRGAGDPALADPDLLGVMDMGVERFVTMVAERVVEGAREQASGGGIREVVVDDRVFDRVLVHPTWPESQLNRRYCAEVSGLNFHRNVICIYARPGAIGRPPSVTVEPESAWIEIVNNARSVGRGKQHTAWASRKFQSNDIGLHGDVRYADNAVEVTIHDPALHFGMLLADRIERAGGGEGIAARLAGEEERLGGGAPAFSVRTPLATVLERCNVDSQNLYAESLLKRVGHEVTGAPGSWANGAAVVRMELIERLGAWAGSDVTVADGSGMSRENRVTTRAIARWLLDLSRDGEIGEAFIASLAEADEKEGTLRKRFRNMAPEHEVRAKTGYLSGVSALSGYVVDHEHGRRVVFSIISNEKPNSIPLTRVRELEERIVVMIDEWLREEAEALGG